MRIQILSVEISSKTSKAGKPYQNAEVAFKNFDTGKVESKNIAQYSKIYKLVAEAAPGQTAEVGVIKNDGGYWEWDSFKRIVMSDQEKTLVPDAAVNKTANVSAAKSSFETAEERAKRQVLIVKQSSLERAVEFLTKTSANPALLQAEEVLELAQIFTDWVFAEKKVDLFSLPNDLDFNAEVE